MHTYSDCLDPRRLLLRAKCSPLPAHRRVGACPSFVTRRCTNCRRDDSERDEENPKDEHSPARKGCKTTERNSRLFIAPDAKIIAASAQRTSDNRGCLRYRSFQESGNHEMRRVRWARSTAQEPLSLVSTPGTIKEETFKLSDSRTAPNQSTRSLGHTAERHILTEHHPAPLGRVVGTRGIRWASREKISNRTLFFYPSTSRGGETPLLSYHRLVRNGI